MVTSHGEQTTNKALLLGPWLIRLVSTTVTRTVEALLPPRRISIALPSASGWAGQERDRPSTCAVCKSLLMLRA